MPLNVVPSSTKPSTVPSDSSQPSSSALPDLLPTDNLNVDSSQPTADSGRRGNSPVQVSHRLCVWKFCTCARFFS